MKNKVVYINTISGEKIFCIILGEYKEKNYYKSEYSEGYIFKSDIYDVEIIGDVINE